MKKIKLMVTVIPFILLAFVFALSANKKTILECYFYDPCGGCFGEGAPCKPCTIELELAKDLTILLSENNLTDSVELRMYNVLKSESRTKFEEKNIKDIPFPIYFVNGKLVDGDLTSALIDKLSLLSKLTHPSQSKPKNSLLEDGEAFVQVTTNTMIYFKSETCPDCIEADAFLKELNPDIEIIIYDTADYENVTLLKKYYEQYNLDPDSLFVPTVFIGNKALIEDEVSTFLAGYIEQGLGEHTLMLVSE